MDKYEVIGMLGEGSFGRVYKAKQNLDGKFVALKVISKRGRSTKELKGLRRECEIQRYLHHPNIIQMLNSFETENEIVVITEFAHKQLYVILGKEGYLPEERVQAIVWDLVSALYYLHSHRVLHRDLKPQNILLDSTNCAKLCDFGFARNMSTGTHVLTSIKGTPLYMAPELIEEQPYDHNADLWSLGCIIYELLVGAPPFCTASILHLIRLIRHEQIQWPTFISENCISFLKGLLQKNPSKRLSWTEILNHPFIRGHVLICDEIPSMPLTRSMSANTLQAKEQQRKDHVLQKTTGNRIPYSNSVETNVEMDQVISENMKTNTVSLHNNITASSDAKKSEPKENKKNSQNVPEKFSKLSIDNKSKEGRSANQRSHEKTCSNNLNSTYNSISVNITNEIRTLQDSTLISVDLGKNKSVKNSEDKEVVQMNIHFSEDSHPIENEEWVVFLQRTAEEVMGGDVNCLLQVYLANIIASPLKNSNTSPKVLDLVANLFSIAFIVRVDLEDWPREQLKIVYLEIKVVPNLMYAVKLLVKEKSTNCSNNCTPTSSGTPSFSQVECSKSINDLTSGEIQAMKNIFMLICYLVHLDERFLIQFCDAVVVLNVYTLLHGLLFLSKKKLTIVTDLIAILTLVLRKSPENFELVHKIIVNSNDLDKEQSSNFVNMLRNTSPSLRERMCILICAMSRDSVGTLENIWNDDIKETLEALVYDSVENVRNWAEICVGQIKELRFYKATDNTLDCIRSH